MKQPECIFSLMKHNFKNCFFLFSLEEIFGLKTKLCQSHSSYCHFYIKLLLFYQKVNFLPQRLPGGNTHGSQQWAAVSTHCLATRLPPQRHLFRPSDVMLRWTIQGHLPSAASSPPMMELPARAPSEPTGQQESDDSHFCGRAFDHFSVGLKPLKQTHHPAHG